MPQKNNPVIAETLVSLFQVSAAMDGLMTQAMSHRQQRDGAAWTLEWHALPQVCQIDQESIQIQMDIPAHRRTDRWMDGQTDTDGQADGDKWTEVQTEAH